MLHDGLVLIAHITGRIIDCAITGRDSPVRTFSHHEEICYVACGHSGSCVHIISRIGIGARWSFTAGLLSQAEEGVHSPALLQGAQGYDSGV